MKLSDKAKQVISAVAPVLGGTLGGPLGGLAGQILAKTLGVDPANPKAVEDAVLAQSPESITQIRLAEIELEKAAQENEIDLERINAADRANARDREVKTGDRTPAYMAYGVSIGFFGVLGYLLKFGIPPQGGEALLVMLGALGTAWTAIIGYFFGSSASSRSKDDTLAHIAKQP